MIRSSLPSEVLSRHCSLDRQLLDFYDLLLSSRKWATAVLQIGVKDGILNGWLEYFPEATVIVLEPDRKKLRYQQRLFSIGLTESNLPFFIAEYTSYFQVVVDGLQDPHLRFDQLLKTLTPNGLYLSESPLYYCVKD